MASTILSSAQKSPESDSRSAVSVERRESFSGYLEWLTDRSVQRPFTGAQIYISRNGTELVNWTTGEAAPRRPMTPSSLVYWSCASKPLLALLIGKLFDEGCLDFDDPICKYLDVFGARGKQRITIRHVLTHTCGFRAVERTTVRAVDYETILRRVVAAPLEDGWFPGETAGYHETSGWYVLSGVVERITGQRFDELIRSELCAAVSTEDMWPSVPTECFGELVDRLVVPSYVAKDGVVRLPFLTSRALVQIRDPAHGCFGTAAALGRLYECMIGERGQFHQRLPIRAATVRKMISENRGPRMDVTWGYTCDMGMGFMIDLSRHRGFGQGWSQASFGHSGRVGAMFSGADPETGVVISAYLGALTDGWWESGGIVSGLLRAASQST